MAIVIRKDNISPLEFYRDLVADIDRGLAQLQGLDNRLYDVLALNNDDETFVTTIGEIRTDLRESISRLQKSYTTTQKVVEFLQDVDA